MNELVEVKQNKTLGRYATVSKDVLAGEILFEEDPFVVGPKPQIGICCLGCCRLLVSNKNDVVNKPAPVAFTQRCAKCEWPLCSENCPMRRWHDEAECNIFAENRVKFYGILNDVDADDGENVCMQMDCITPLR